MFKMRLTCGSEGHGEAERVQRGGWAGAIGRGKLFHVLPMVGTISFCPAGTQPCCILPRRSGEQPAHTPERGGSDVLRRGRVTLFPPAVSPC